MFSDFAIFQFLCKTAISREDCQVVKRRQLFAPFEYTTDIMLGPHIHRGGPARNLIGSLWY